jgi:DNA-directed RNA polymerase subunit RPC12/RpoP
MKARVIFPLIIGILLVTAGIIFLVFFGIGQDRSTVDLDENVGSDQYYVVGGKKASRITGDYTSSQPISVYITTDESVMDYIISIQGLDDVDTIATNSVQGDIEYDTQDSNLDYYLLFENRNDVSSHLEASVEFHYDITNILCLIPGIIFLIVGIVLILVAYISHKRAKSAPQQYPAQMPQQQYYAQTPAQQYPQQPQQQYAPPPQTSSMTYSCPHCGRPFTMQRPFQDTVVNCPSCRGQVTIGPV